jgi:hypothetical protein
MVQPFEAGMDLRLASKDVRNDHEVVSVAVDEYAVQQ